MIKLYFNNLSGIFGGYTGVIAASFAYISEVHDNIVIFVLLFLYFVFVFVLYVSGVHTI